MGDRYRNMSEKSYIFLLPHQAGLPTYSRKQRVVAAFWEGRFSYQNRFSPGVDLLTRLRNKATTPVSHGAMKLLWFFQRMGHTFLGKQDAPRLLLCMFLRSWETHRYHGEDQMARRRKLRPAPTSTSISFALATIPDGETLVNIIVGFSFSKYTLVQFQRFHRMEIGCRNFSPAAEQEKTFSVVLRAKIHTFEQNLKSSK